MKKKALLIAPSFDEPGGGTCVAAWALQGLLDEFDVTLVAWKRPDLAVMNQRFGTSVEAADLPVVVVPAPLRLAIDAIPLRLALLRRCVIQWVAARHMRAERFDAVASAGNEMEVGRPMVQYVHFPWAAYPRPDYDLRWWHGRLLVQLYRWVVIGIFEHSREAVRQNLTLVNSAWTGRYYGDWYNNAAYHVVYPPAPVPAATRPWAERRNGFVCLGRYAHEKRIVEVIAILQQVRARGFDVTLDICGQIDSHAYYRKVRAAAAAAGDWVRVHLDLPRADLIELISGSRYGIHGMVGEHFGIAIAELVRLGCVCFANEDGGPAEILADQRLLFDTDQDAIDKICAVLADPDAQMELSAVVETRGALFSPEAFMEGFTAACRENALQIIS